MRTKDFPGCDRLTGFVAFTPDLSARVRGCPGELWLRSFPVRSGTCQDESVPEEARHVPGDALLEHWHPPS